ncbi:MAG: cadherin domain-containing protein [Cyclobacteriaceae bacterium]
MKRLATYTTALILVLSQLAYAQAPNWSVDPSQFENSMNVTASAVIGQMELDDDTDMIGAFVGAEVRGVTNIDILLNSTGKKVAFLTILSNQNSGETITFKVYDASENSITDAITQIEFSGDAIIGTTSSPLIITDNSPPTDITLSNNQLQEGSAAGTTVGTLSTTDADAGETFDYALIAGDGSTNNAAFTIDGNNLNMSQVIDFEDNPSLAVRISATDSRGASVEKAFTIEVTNTNDAPTALDLSNATLPESTPSGALIGEFEVTDEDEDEEYEFLFVEGAGDDDNDKFNIVSNDLRLNTAVDFETQNTFEIRVQATSDEGGVITEIFDITITNVNEAPSALEVDGLQLSENIGVGTEIATLSATDEDAGEAFTYSLVGTTNPDHAAFSISGDKLITAAQINFEEQSVYELNLRVTDSGDNTKDVDFEFRVLNENDSPTSIHLDKLIIQENLSAGLLVGQLSTVDEDDEDQHTYSLVAGDGDNDNGLFIISGNQLLTNRTLDFETNPSHTVRVQSSDGVLTTASAFELSVINTNDDPTGLNLDNQSVDENSGVGTLIGIFTLEDVDIARASYTMVAGVNDNASFVINGADLITSEVFDFETDQQYNIDVQASDGDGGLIVRRFVISINDTNDSPTDLLFSASDLSEEAAIGTLVGELITTDVDLNQSFTYTLENHTDFFTIEGSQVVTIAALEFDDAASYILEIRTTDQDGASLLETFIVNIIEVVPINNPPLIEDFEFSISENAATGTIIGVISGSDPDGDVVTYRLQPSFEGQAFGFDGITGTITVDNSLDYERQSSYEFTVEVVDLEGLTDEASVLILLEDEIEPELLASDFLSANDDGYNDTFIIQSPGLYSSYRLTISNGSRVQVFSTTGYNNDWSGTSADGDPLPVGLYYYSLKSPDGSIEFTGTITLAR